MTMKKTLLALSILTLMIFNTISANEIHGQADKMYVSPGTVYIAPEGIYLNVDGQLVPVQIVGHDKGGIFVEGAGEYLSSDYVKCKQCGLTYNRETQSMRCPHNSTQGPRK